MAKDKNKSAETDLVPEGDSIVDLDAGDFEASDLMTESTIESLLKDGFQMEKFVTMREGDKILGYLLGRGPDAVVKQNGKVSPISTWLFKHKSLNFTMRILGAALTESGSAQGLDQELMSKPIGVLCYVEKCEQVDIGGGRRANRWIVACKPSDRLKNVNDYVKTVALLASSAAANGVSPAEEQRIS